MDKTLYDEYDGKIISLLLCNDSYKVVFQHALFDYYQPIGVSDYQYSKTILENLKSALPSVEEIEEELSQMDVLFLCL